eukprot:CAMPEP_0168738856 /NCGR_PEP_ID=MMETSP0724-20121128/11153_1 /TAXON_ID=265536 /ORGANISM="Amphiprora sp., Strain CCMP467" /LENGTH=281 /DNA_ID=CAMNT_0008786221 /DNA_START=66 /DNA_END=911 /DNA_ORIENTATION=+
MAKFTATVLATLVAGSSAFVSQQPATFSTTLKAKEGVWDPMGLMELGSGEAFDTFPGQQLHPSKQTINFTMAKFTATVLATLVAGSSAFVSQQPATFSTTLKAKEGVWDPMGLMELGSGEAFDTFPGMFPNEQFLREAEIKHGRQAMLAWTGVWATSKDPFGLALHFPGAPDCDDWTTALGVFAKEEPAVFGAVLAVIAACEGESVGHSGDNFIGVSTKETPGNLNFDYLGMKGKLGEEGVARYADVEIKNGRAAMIAMASLFAFKSIPGSVPIMDVLGAH